MTGLEWLEGEDALGYLFDMIFAQMYATMNRKIMAQIILHQVLGIPAIDSIKTVHNFIDFQDLVIRKGSVRSCVGEKFILPFNMRDGLLICEGKSNPEWNFSAPHGAGRLMSRGQAKRELSIDKFQADMYSSSINKSTLDESPDAYKPASIIEDAIDPTATIVDRVRPLLNLKDSSEGRMKVNMQSTTHG